MKIILDKDEERKPYLCNECPLYVSHSYKLTSFLDFINRTLPKKECSLGIKNFSECAIVKLCPECQSDSYKWAYSGWKQCGSCGHTYEEYR